MRISGTKDNQNKEGDLTNSPKNTERRMRPCPICSKLSTPAFYPFCSDRCQKVDLNRWLSEGYTIPVVETDDVELPEE